MFFCCVCVWLVMSSEREGPLTELFGRCGVFRLVNGSDFVSSAEQTRALFSKNTLFGLLLLGARL